MNVSRVFDPCLTAFFDILKVEVKGHYESRFKFYHRGTELKVMTFPAKTAMFARSLEQILRFRYESSVAKICTLI